jgi:hypothetical protein
MNFRMKLFILLLLLFVVLLICLGIAGCKTELSFELPVKINGEDKIIKASYVNTNFEKQVGEFRLGFDPVTGLWTLYMKDVDSSTDNVLRAFELGTALGLGASAVPAP